MPTVNLESIGAARVHKDDDRFALNNPLDSHCLGTFSACKSFLRDN
jgi:hypothetical protein